MAPKRKTGVQNVDIGGAYKLDRQLETEQKPDQVSLGCSTTHRTARIEHPASFMSDAVSQKHDVATTDIADLDGEQEDVDAELEALAMECVSCCCSGCQGSFATIGLSLLHSCHTFQTFVCFRLQDDEGELGPAAADSSTEVQISSAQKASFVCDSDCAVMQYTLLLHPLQHLFVTCFREMLMLVRMMKM